MKMLTNKFLESRLVEKVTGVKLNENWKINIVGASNVGISELCYQLHDTKRQTIMSELGFEVKRKFVQLNPMRCIELIPNCAQKVEKLFTSSVGIVFVYDISDSQSFAYLEDLLEKVDMSCFELAQSGVILWLLGNKSDLDVLRQVSAERGKNLAMKYGMKFAEVSSARTQSKYLDRVFKLILQDVIRRFPLNCSKILDKDAVLGRRSFRLLTWSVYFMTMILWAFFTLLIIRSSIR